MNLLVECLLLTGLPLGMIAGGYWPVAGLHALSAAQRLATACLLGLMLFLLNVSVINFFSPLSGFWAWVCLWPIALTLMRRRYIKCGWTDFKSIVGSRHGLVVGIFYVTFVTLLLWPLFTHPTYVYYDGTSNHDAFFWIAGAEHLKRHTYMEVPITSPVHPFMNTVSAIIGWRPGWGRMGAEGLLALIASIIGLAPLKLYLAATAALFVPWIASVFLIVKTFHHDRLNSLATIGLVALQPIFVYFIGNSNLPNLVGALAASAVVLGTEWSLSKSYGRGVSLTFVVLGVQGLLCSYPEMVPFVVMPAGLLWLRHLSTRSRIGGSRIFSWHATLLTGSAWIAGAAVNPASTLRAWSGFLGSFENARANRDWANLFDPLSCFEYVPALATLAVNANRILGSVIGGIMSVVLVLGIVMAVRRASDRWGSLFTVAGALTLLAYTLCSGFSYGWQKTVQFGGTFWAAFLPVALIEVYASASPVNRYSKYLVRGALGAIMAFFSFATVSNCLDGYKWSHRKLLTTDWFAVRQYARDHLAHASVLVDGASFQMAFFHGMWASYFLADSDIYFAARGSQNGGYLRDSVVHESRVAIPIPMAYLVSREWADAFDANSERLFVGDTVVLLKTANRVLRWEGFQHTNGVPYNMESHVVIELVPHARSRLVVIVVPRHPENPVAKWDVSVTEGTTNISTTTSAVPPWTFTLPLTPGRLNRVELTADIPPPADRLPPFMVRKIWIETVAE